MKELICITIDRSVDALVRLTGGQPLGIIHPLRNASRKEGEYLDLLHCYLLYMESYSMGVTTEGGGS